MDQDSIKKSEFEVTRRNGSTSPERVADPEVSPKARRRSFTKEYKLRILEEADACTPGSGEIGALLRREGLYSSNLQKWRQQREKGVLQGLEPKKRGRKPTRHPLEDKIAELEKKNDELQRRLKKAETIIDVQKKSPSCWD